jgi:iron complex outermembrane receptor protein
MIERLSTKHVRWLRFILPTALGVLPLTAAAQDVPTSRQDEIIVTAQRREQAVGSVPIALTVITDKRLEDEAITNLDRLGSVVPNLTLVRNFGTSSGALVFMRGVGEGDSIFTNDPPVGIYVDDVFLPRSRR